MKETFLTVFGLNHNTAPVEIRERLHLQESGLPDLLKEIKHTAGAETVIVSTCNRTEVYLHSRHPETSLEKTREVFTGAFQFPTQSLQQYTYTMHGEEAVKHLFLVASGLDSLVLGEPEILGQVKDAYRIAASAKTTGFITNKVFHKAFSTAKRVRTETRIGYNPLSISSMAIELAKKIFVSLEEKRILVIGAGEMCRTALKYFHKEGLRDVLITNRTYENAYKLAEEIMGQAYPFDELADLLLKVDMVLSSTGSEEPILDKPFVHSVMKKRKQKPLFFIDIAVPRDISPEVNDLDNVYLYDIDDLKDLSQKHFSERMDESEKAHGIIDEELAAFTESLRHAAMAPLITHIVNKAEQMRADEVRKVLQKLDNADPDTVRLIEGLTRTITNKLIHPHIALMKQHNSKAMVEILKDYFQFEEEDEERMDYRDQGEQTRPETD